MRISFVALGSEQLAVSLLANIAKSKGHTVNLAFSTALFHDRFNLEIPWLNRIFDDTDETIEALRQQQPDVIVFSVLTATYQWMLKVAADAKFMFPDAVTIFGGVHVSAVPERVLSNPQVDYVVVGEGDEAFPAILDAIENNDKDTPIFNTRFINADGREVRGTQRAYYQEMDKLPPFSKEIWEEYIFVADHYMTMTSRGCPYRCSFCFNNFFTELPDDKANRGKYVRHRSVEHVLEELRYAKERYGKMKWVDFQDDVFTTDKKWLAEFLTRYKAEIGLPFQCLTHPRYMDDDIALMLKEAGCEWVQMGIQTMDDDLKSGALRRNEKAEHIRKSLSAMKKAGLKVKVDHMFGLPDEPLSAQEKARELYAEFCPARIQPYWTCFLPGTELLQQGLDLGIVTPEEAKRLNEGEDFYFFRNAQNIKDPEVVRIYQGYEFLFRLYPVLPRAFRLRLKEKHVRWIPFSLKSFLGQVVDLAHNILLRNPDHDWYLKYYLLHLYRFFLKKIGFRKLPPAVRPKNPDLQIDLTKYAGQHDKIRKTAYAVVD